MKLASVLFSFSIHHKMMKTSVLSSVVLFSPQPREIQFTVTEDDRNQKILAFKKKKKTGISDYSSLKKYSNRLIYNLTNLSTTADAFAYLYFLIIIIKCKAATDLYILV